MYKRQVEAVRADAARRMELREREVISVAREAVVNAEGGKRVAEVTAQATIGELHQRNTDLMRELEDYKQQQSHMTRDLEAARQCVSQVHNETAGMKTQVQSQMNALSSEVTKWKDLAERRAHDSSPAVVGANVADPRRYTSDSGCLLYTSDAADE